MFTRSEIIVMTNTQTNRCCWEHPTLFARLRRWVTSSTWAVRLGWLENAHSRPFFSVGDFDP